MRSNGQGGIGRFLVAAVVIAVLFFTVQNNENGLAGVMDNASGKLNEIISSASDSLEESVNNGNTPKKGEASGKYDPNTFLEKGGKAQKKYSNAKEGEVTYLPLDKKGRAQGAYGIITQKMHLENGEREDIKVDPAGWGFNKQETLKNKDHSYHGWIYNRSHLVADSLGGNASRENLITGTRMQNVGWNDGKGGMGYLETKTRNFLKKPENKNCGVYYSAVPIYRSDDELVPVAVTVDAKSCDEKIDERVIVYNIAPGFDINYKDGSYKKMATS